MNLMADRDGNCEVLSRCVWLEKRERENEDCAVEGQLKAIENVLCGSERNVEKIWEQLVFARERERERNRTEWFLCVRESLCHSLG